MEHNLDDYSWIIWGCCKASHNGLIPWDQMKEALEKKGEQLGAVQEHFGFRAPKSDYLILVLKDWTEAAILAQEWHRLLGREGIVLTRADIEKAVAHCDKVGPGMWAMSRTPWAVWF